MSKALNIALFSLLIYPRISNAQVYIDRPIEVIGTESERQVIGLPMSIEPDAVLTAGAEQRGILRTSITVSDAPWVVDLPALGNSPGAGTHMLLLAPITAPGPVSIILNGNGPFPIRSQGAALDGSDVVEGTMLSLIHDGDAFQLINGRSTVRRNCPEGMVPVNAQYCIEDNERNLADFFEAAVACSLVDRRLCSWGEFVAACHRAQALGLMNMTNNWEWTNNTSNEDNSGRIVGVSGCEVAGNSLASGSIARRFRCCYTR